MPRVAKKAVKNIAKPAKQEPAFSYAELVFDVLRAYPGYRASSQELIAWEAMRKSVLGLRK